MYTTKHTIIIWFPRNRRVSPIYHIFSSAVSIVYISVCTFVFCRFYLLNSTFISLPDSFILNGLQKQFKNTLIAFLFYTCLIHSREYLSCVYGLGAETYSSLFLVVVHRQKSGQHNLSISSSWYVFSIRCNCTYMYGYFSLTRHLYFFLWNCGKKRNCTYYTGRLVWLKPSPLHSFWACA